MAVNEDDSSISDEVTQHKSNTTTPKDGDELTVTTSVAHQLDCLDLSRSQKEDRQYLLLNHKKTNDSSSIHSHKSDLSALACHTSTTSRHGGGVDVNNDSLNNSFDFNDSCASFASFGDSETNGSKSSLHDSATGGDALLVEEQQPQQPPAADAKRTLLMGRLPDSRLVRHASLRYTSLQLIQENDAD